MDSSEEHILCSSPNPFVPSDPGIRDMNIEVVIKSPMNFKAAVINQKNMPEWDVVHILGEDCSAIHKQILECRAMRFLNIFRHNYNKAEN